MESSIAQFLMRHTACELMPTKTLEPGRLVWTVKCKEAKCDNSATTVSNELLLKTLFDNQELILVMINPSSGRYKHDYYEARAQIRNITLCTV